MAELDDSIRRLARHLGRQTATTVAGVASALSAEATREAERAAAAVTPAGIGAEPALGSPGTDGYVLASTAAGARSWVAQSGGGGGGMTNPMTAEDDLIVGGTAGAPARLAKGADGQVLTVDAATHHLVWADPAGGGGGSLTVEGADGSSSVGSVTTLRIGPPFVVTNQGGGVALIGPSDNTLPQSGSVVFSLDPASGTYDSDDGCSALANGGYSFEQASSGNRPFACSYKGARALRFAGAQALVTPSGHPAKPASWSMAVAIVPTLDTNNQAILMSASSGGTNDSTWGIGQVTTQAIRAVFSNGSTGNFHKTRNADLVLHNLSAWVVTYSAGDSEIKLYQDGRLCKSTLYAGGSTTSSGGTAYAMALGRLGEFAGHYWYGLLLRAALWSTALSADDAASAAKYLLGLYR